jgi:basic membrane protein A
MKIFRAAMGLLLPLLLLAPGCTSISRNCLDPEVFCVGLVTETGRRDDRAGNQAAWEGLQQAKLNGVVDWIASIETIDSRDYEENILVFAEESYDVIVTVGTGSSADTTAAAGIFSNIHFIGVDQRQYANGINLPNLTWLVFPEDQLGFLAGALAASMTQTGLVGAVCASDSWRSMKSYGDGFLAGVVYINPQVKGTVTYHNEVGLDKTFSDPEWGATAANSLVDNGTDIIFGVGGTTGSNAVASAAMRSAYGIGADFDQYHLLPVASGRILTSVLKLITPGIVDLLRAVKDAQAGTSPFPSGNYTGQIGFAPFHELDSLVPEEVKQKVTGLPQEFLSGRIQIEYPAMAP